MWSDFESYDVFKVNGDKDVVFSKKFKQRFLEGERQINVFIGNVGDIGIKPWQLSNFSRCYNLLDFNFPETKLNPNEIPSFVESMLLIQKLGQGHTSILTLSYNLCKYFDLKRKSCNEILFHTFEKITKEEAKHLYNFTFERESFEDFCKDFDGIFYKHNREEYFKNIENNEIVDALIQLYHDEIEKEL
jgi:hypothetical protein